MTLVLPAVSGVLTGRSPIVGVPAEAEAAARTLSRLQQEIDTSRLHASESLICLHLMNATSVTKIVNGLNDRFLPGAARLSEDLSTASTAFGVYSDEIERIHSSARNTIADVEQHLSKIQSCAWEMERAAVTLRFSAGGNVPSHWYQKPSIWPPLTSEVLDDLTPGEAAARAWATGTWTTQAIAWGWATDRIQESQTRWNNLIAERRESEQKLVSKLKQTNLGSLIDFKGVPDRSGITRTYTGGPVHPSRLMTDPLLQDIMSGRFTPEQVAAKWKELGLTDEQVEQLPIQALFALAKADGIPFRVQDIASQKAFEYSIENPDEAFRILGLSPTEMSIGDFKNQISDLKQALDDAETAAFDLPGRPVVQLVGFGTHDGALTAAISLGDIDNASNVAVNVSGMDSNVSGIGNGVNGAQTLFTETRKADPNATPAIVTWIGYRSPNTGEVFHGDRAVAGAVPLASFIDGINVVRDQGEKPLKEFVVLAHSYGSTTAAEALKLTTTRRVDAFITYGSAGLENDTTLDQLNADKVYATMAKGDQIAGIGLGGSGRTDPRDIPGVVEFSSEDENGGKRVTMHGMYADEGEWSLVNWTKTGYLSAGTESAASMGRVIAGMKP